MKVVVQRSSVCFALSLESTKAKECHFAKKTLYIHQLTTMLSTSKNVLFPGHNHLLTTGTADPTP